MQSSWQISEALYLLQETLDARADSVRQFVTAHRAQSEQVDQRGGRSMAAKPSKGGSSFASIGAARDKAPMVSLKVKKHKKTSRGK
jgi:hypothetical protein